MSTLRPTCGITVQTTMQARRVGQALARSLAASQAAQASLAAGGIRRFSSSMLRVAVAIPGQQASGAITRVPTLAMNARHMSVVDKIAGVFNGKRGGGDVPTLTLESAEGIAQMTLLQLNNDNLTYAKALASIKVG